MRCVAGVGLLLLGGCNQIFGISASQPWDAAPPVHGAQLTWLIAGTTDQGAPLPAPVSVPFSGDAAPAIRIAPLDGPFVPASFSQVPGEDGRIPIPASYLGGASGPPRPWRLEYTTTAGAVPHEVQWAPDDNAGHLVVPLAGRVRPAAAPLGGGYTVTTSPPASYVAPRIWTTGLWTDGLATPTAPGTVDYDFSTAVALSGSKGNLDPRLDRGFLVDFDVDAGSGCQRAVGAAQLSAVALTAGAHTAQTVSWDTRQRPVISDPVGFDFIDRLATVLGKLHGSFNGNGSGLWFGVVPSREFPGLTASSPLLPLPVPVMQVLLRCPYNASPLPGAVLPAALVEFPIAVHVQLVDTRQVLGVNLHSGLEAVITPSPNGGFAIAFPAAMPTKMTLSTPATAATAPLDLAGPDLVAAGAPTGPFALDFVPEAGGDVRADYYDVVLHRIVAGALTTERIYTITAPHLQIDPGVLVGGADYVLEIRSFKGQRMAAHGDFTQVDMPYGGAIVFASTFHTS